MVPIKINILFHVNKGRKQGIRITWKRRAWEASGQGTPRRFYDPHTYDHSRYEFYTKTLRQYEYFEATQTIVLQYNLCLQSLMCPFIDLSFHLTFSLLETLNVWLRHRCDYSTSPPSYWKSYETFLVY